MDCIKLVWNNEIIQDHLDQAQTQFQHSLGLKPPYVGLELAKDANQHSDDLFAEALGGISIAQKPERYVEIEK